MRTRLTGRGRAGSVLTLGAFGLAGCAVGPDYVRPAPPQGYHYTAAPLPSTASTPVPAGNAQKFVTSLHIPAQWWIVFHSPKLNAMVDQALRGNPSVDAAAAALKQAHELYLVQWTALFPLVEGNFNWTRAKFSNALTSPVNTLNPTYSLSTAQLNVSYTPDVFGGTRRAIESAKASEEASRYQLEATYLTLSSNVVTTAVQEASLRAQVEATQRMAAIEHDLTEKLRLQRSLGTASELDLRTQEATEAQTIAALPPLQKQLEQAHDALAALLGRYPDDPAVASFRLADLTLPSDLPVSLPAQLVSQRPDIRQAEENLHAATAQVGVAISDFLPQFAIDGNAGSSALKIGSLFAPGSGFWEIGGSVTQTIFDAGALLHRKRAADAALRQAAAQYKSTVIAAIQNVADTLRALEADADAVRDASRAADATERSLAIAEGEFRLGTVSQVSLLTSEVTYRQAELNLIQAQASRFADTAGLFQALGGGWWNRVGTAPG